MITELEESHLAIALPSTRALAARLAADKQEIADEMFNFIGSALPAMRTDDPLSRLGRGTCLSIVELMLAMMEHAIPADRAEPPVLAVEYACLIADRGLPLDDLLRAYRLGHACFARIITDAITDSEKDSAELASAVRETEQFLFALVDVVSSKIGAAYVEQSQRLHSRTASQRRDLVHALLEGDPRDLKVAERSLGHRLTGPQLAFICWSDSEPDGLPQAVASMQGVLNAPRPLVLPPEDFALAGWFEMSRVDPRTMNQLPAAVPGAVHVALGPVLPGLNGFRRSRAAAGRVRRVVGLSQTQAPSMTRWEDVALVDALSMDLEAARDLVRHELGSLTRGGDDAETLRQTVRAFVASGYSYTAVASSLHVHRNTVLQRVKKAQKRRGRPLTERPAELLAALELVDTIGPALLDG